MGDFFFNEIKNKFKKKIPELKSEDYERVRKDIIADDRYFAPTPLINKVFAMNFPNATKTSSIRELIANIISKEICFATIKNNFINPIKATKITKKTLQKRIDDGDIFFALEGKQLYMNEKEPLGTTLGSIDDRICKEKTDLSLPIVMIEDIFFKKDFLEYCMPYLSVGKHLVVYTKPKRGRKDIHYLLAGKILMIKDLTKVVLI